MGLFGGCCGCCSCFFGAGGYCGQYHEPKERDKGSEYYPEMLGDDAKGEALDGCPQCPVFEEQSLLLDVVDITLQTVRKALVLGNAGLDQVGHRQAEKRAQDYHVEHDLFQDRD